MKLLFLIPFLLFSSATMADITTVDIKLSSKDKDYLKPVYRKLGRFRNRRLIKIKRSKEKYQFTKPEVSVNGVPLKDVELGTRGNQCLKAPRRCFSVKFNEQVRINNLQAEGFNLISMWQDEGYTTAEIGYSFYKELGLFHLDREYVEVKIDGKSNGLYLLSQRPNKNLKKKFNSAFIGRVGYFTKLEVKKYHKKKTKFEQKDFERTFDEIVKKSKKVSKDKLYDYLAYRMNIDKYLKWLALNTFMQNGDYVDEVYFYADDESKHEKIYFDIMAWDLDDLFKKPHFGPWNNLRFRRKLKKSLLYSMESKLDRLINDSPILYSKFKQILKEMLTTEINDSFIDVQIDSVIKKISPYLTEPILALSKMDDREGAPYTKTYILNLIEKRRQLLKTRRILLLERVRDTF